MSVGGKPPESKPARRPATAYIWRRVVLLRRGYAELHQVTNGAFAFNTVAKVLAWGGTCAIVLLLLHKVHQIQRELDPVGQGLQQLQQQLRTANTSVATSTKASEDELESLRTRAQRLKASLDSASRAEHDQSEPSLLKARREARDLADALAREADALQQIAGTRAVFAHSLGDYQEALVRAETEEAAQIRGIADGGATAERSLHELSDAAARASARIEGAAPQARLDQLATAMQKLQSRLGDLEGQVDRVSRELAAVPPRAVPTPPPAPAQMHPVASANLAAGSPSR